MADLSLIEITGTYQAQYVPKPTPNPIVWTGSGSQPVTETLTNISTLYGGYPLLVVPVLTDTYSFVVTTGGNLSAVRFSISSSAGVFATKTNQALTAYGVYSHVLKIDQTTGNDIAVDFTGSTAFNIGDSWGYTITAPYCTAPQEDPRTFSLTPYYAPTLSNDCLVNFPPPIPNAYIPQTTTPTATVPPFPFQIYQDSPTTSAMRGGDICNTCTGSVTTIPDDNGVPTAAGDDTYFWAKKSGGSFSQNSGTYLNMLADWTSYPRQPSPPDVNYRLIGFADNSTSPGTMTCHNDWNGGNMDWACNQTTYIPGKQPFDVIIDGTHTSLYLMPGTINQVLPTNMLSSFSISSSGNYCVYLSVNTDGYTVVNATINVSGSVPSQGIISTPAAAPSSFNIVIGMINSGVLTQVAHGNINATTVPTIQQDRYPPVVGMSTTIRWYSWTVAFTTI